jgi:hypothetical protein
VGEGFKAGQNAKRGRDEHGVAGQALELRVAQLALGDRIAAVRDVVAVDAQFPTRRNGKPTPASTVVYAPATEVLPLFR